MSSPPVNTLEAMAPPAVVQVRRKDLTPYRFMIRVLLVMSPVILFLAGAELFLWLSGETVPVKTVATRYDRFGPPSAYLPVLIGQQFNLFHYARVTKLRPELLVLGSSRVTRFRQEMFAPEANFYNSGRTISCVGDLEEYFAVLPQDYSPKTLLLGIDSWWFRENMSTPARFASDIRKDDTRSVNAHIYAYRKLVHSVRRGQITPSLLRKILFRQDGGVKRFGLIAWNSAGMRNDGSNQTFDRSTPTAYQDGVPEEIQEILKSRHPSLQPALRTDDNLLQRFEAALKAVEKKGTRIIGFAPPFASEVRETYADHPDYFGFYAAYREKIKNLFARNGWYFFDGSDPASLGMDDRVMKDKDHAQETYHVALLLRMSQDAVVREALHLRPNYLKSLLSDPDTTPWYPDWSASKQ